MKFKDKLIDGITNEKFGIIRNSVHLLRNADISYLIGEVVIEAEIIRTNSKLGFSRDVSILYLKTDNYIAVFYYEPDCCATCTIDDVSGDLNSLVGSKLTTARVSTNKSEEEGDSNTWTYYHFATIKGYVDIKWFGESNGFYSEEVSMSMFKNEKPVQE